MRADSGVMLYLRLRDEVLPGMRALRQGEVALVPKAVVCRARGCASRRFRWLRSAKGDRWVCAAPTCGADWPTKRVNVATPAGHGTSPLETHANDIRRVERPLEGLRLWPRRTILAYVHAARLRDTVQNLHREEHAAKQAVRSFHEALGRAPAWERHFVAAAARILACAPERRRVEVVAEGFRAVFPRAKRAPTTAYAVRNALREARQGYERAAEPRSVR